jgi:hypothetical protein
MGCFTAFHHARLAAKSALETPLRTHSDQGAAYGFGGTVDTETTGFSAVLLDDRGAADADLQEYGITPAIAGE